MPPPRPPEFRHRAVEFACQGTALIAKTAKDLGISESCLRDWLAQAGADESSGLLKAATGVGLITGPVPASG